MIAVKINTKQFMKDVNNIIDYSVGFVEGFSGGRNAFLHQLGPQIKAMVEEFIDSNARVAPETLHHVYEWYRTGSPDARLYDISYTVSNLGLSFGSSFKQSQSVQEGSKQPFYDKARIMELGSTVIIKPKNSEVLKFEIDGEEIFTKQPVTVRNPGGNVRDNYRRVFDLFFKQYFKQSFLKSSGLLQYFNNPQVYKKNLSIGKRGGKNAGVKTGYRWVVNAAAATR